MKGEVGFCFKGSLQIIGIFDGKPDVIRRGAVFPSPVPGIQWELVKHSFLAHGAPALFDCPQCAQSVFTFREEKSRTLMQVCQCTVVCHLHGSSDPYRSAESWVNFREMFQQESQRPVPEDGLKLDPFNGKTMGLNEKGKTWIRNRVGFSSAIDITDDGLSFIYQDSSISVDPETFGQSMLAGKGAEFLAINMAASRVKNGAGPDEVPDAIVILGNDPDYVWPDSTALDRISSLPYRCPACKARVRRAPLIWPTSIDEIYCCLCACAMFHRDATRCRSSGQWQELRLASREREIKHRARLAGNKS